MKCWMYIVRSILELAVPVWNAGLTKHESNQIERVQRSAFHIILGEGYVCYENALETLDLGFFDFFICS